MKIQTEFDMNKNQSFLLILKKFGLQAGAELGQHPTLPPGLTSKLLKDTLTRVESFVARALQHIRLVGLRTLASDPPLKSLRIPK